MGEEETGGSTAVEESEYFVPLDTKVTWDQI